MQLHHAARYRVHIRARSREAEFRLDARQHFHPVRAAMAGAEIVIRECQRGPEVEVGGVLKIRRKHAHYLKAATVDDEFAADQSWVRSKPASPESMAEQCHVIASGLLFLRKENTAQLGLDAQHGKETRGDRGALHALRQAAGGDVEAVAGDGGDVRKALVQLTEIRKLRRGNPVLIVRQPDAHKLRPKLHQMVGMLIRERTQQHGVHHAEDGGVGADPKREGEYGGHCESRRFAREPERKPQILHKN